MASSNRYESAWLLGAAAASALTFGVNLPSWGNLGLWVLRSVGAGCAISVVVKSQRGDTLDPQAELITAFEYQLLHQQGQFQIQLAQVSQQWQEREQEIVAQYQYQFEQLQRDIAQLNEERSQLEVEREALYEWAERQSQELEDERKEQQADLEASQQRLENEIDQLRQETIEDVQALFDREVERVNAHVQELELELENLQQENTTLKQRNTYLERCRRPPRNGGANDKANEIIDVCEEQGIWVDCLEAPYTSMFTDVIWLTPKRGVKASDVIRLAPDFQLRLGVNQAVECSISDGRVKVEVQRDKEALQVSKAKQSDLIESRLVSLDSVRKSSTGFFLVGNSGAAKSSAGMYLAGSLTEEEPAEVLVLDPHGKLNFQKLWGRSNLPYISDVDLILEQLHLLEDELDRRLDTEDEEFTPVIILVDEVSSLFERLDKEGIKQVSKLLKRLGSEGRKYRMTLICVLHSNNCAAIGIDSKQRTNYTQVVCGDIVSLYVKNDWTDKDPRKAWVSEKAYPCLIVKGADLKLAKHPTHHDYAVVEEGNAPKNLKPVRQRELTIPLASGCESLRTTSRQNAQAIGADFTTPAPGAPPRTSASDDVVQRLNHAFSLDYEASESDRTAPAPLEFDPLHPAISPALVQRVLDVFDEEMGQNRTIQRVWGVAKSGTSQKYRAAKWLFRKILNDHSRKLPGKAWGEDPDDLKTFEEVLGE